MAEQFIEQDITIYRVEIKDGDKSYYFESDPDGELYYCGGRVSA